MFAVLVSKVLHFLSQRKLFFSAFEAQPGSYDDVKIYRSNSTTSNDDTFRISELRTAAVASFLANVMMRKVFARKWIQRDRAGDVAQHDDVKRIATTIELEGGRSSSVLTMTQPRILVSPPHAALSACICIPAATQPSA